MEETVTVPNNPYNNELALEVLVKMMKRKEILTISTVLDKYGYEAIEIESKKISKFQLQINYDLWGVVTHYLLFGKVREPLPCATSNLTQHEDRTSNEYAEFVLTDFLSNDREVELHMRLIPEIVDKPDRLTATFCYKFGIVVFKVKRTESVKALLESKGF